MAKKKQETRGGYQGPRDPGTGMTPRQLVDSRRAQLIALEIMEKRGQLVQKSDVDTGMRECAEVIQSDLFGALPSRCATELGNKKLSPEKVRQIVLKLVDAMVKNWQKAELVPE